MLIPKEFDINADGTVDDNANISMVKREDGLEVQIWVRPNASKFVKVILRSKTKMGLMSSSQMDLDPSNMKLKVAAMAGSLAEYQCEKFGDKHEPVEVATFAVESFREAMISAGLEQGKTFIGV